MCHGDAQAHVWELSCHHVRVCNARVVGTCPHFACSHLTHSTSPPSSCRNTFTCWVTAGLLEAEKCFGAHISLQVDERPSKGSDQMLLMRIRSKVELCFCTSHTWASASHLQLWQHALLSSAKLVGIDKHACYHMHCKGFLTPSRPCPQQE